MNVKAKLQNLMDTQYSRPAGVLGWFIGEKMIRQHKPETLWTIENLQLQKNERILEIGCGAGFAMKLIASSNGSYSVTGLDVSETLLQSAALRNKKAIRQKQMSLVHGRVEEMPFPDEEFTAVFSIHSVYFWEDLSKSLKEIERVLSPGGTALITLCDGKDGEDWTTIKKMIQGELLPIMEQLKFTDLRVLEGPVSRGYHTVAVCGVKSSSQ
ncbi:class I SAM-dependent methyltransferase [Rossellomorea vietnamensis]|uniref:Class I SAM-dependent methyltransferase n=1 Tax=Rossellomorea vietnamensis TaxID=218284 RepID=A0ACD4C6L2_9BACI|nr:class I SAM-dependent methyltransferase [Rossellomorea vietnamensis]UXH44071.1 class I SAM-dependent methyltransferase [Rossellomorea vietnamensis]